MSLMHRAPQPDQLRRVEILQNAAVAVPLHSSGWMINSMYNIYVQYMYSVIHVFSMIYNHIYIVLYR